MHFTATVHHGPDCLLVQGCGPALLTDLGGFMDLVGTVAHKGRCRRAVLDLLGVELALTEGLRWIGEPPVNPASGDSA